jgi:integrase
MPKQAKGWLRRRIYAEGEVWLFCFYTCRPTDKKRVENYEIIGPVRDFPSEAEAWLKTGRLGYWKLLDPSISLSTTFGEIAQHWRKEELTKTGAIGKRAGETISTHESLLDGYLLPKWAAVKALNMQPVDIENWFEELATKPNMRYYHEGQQAPNGKPEKPLNWGGIQKIKSTMSLVFSHALRNKLIPVAVESNPFRDSKELGGVRCKASTEYDATVVSPEQMIIILHRLDTPMTQMEWMMAILHAITAVRPEEGFALKWKDIDWRNGQINLCRAWSKGKLTEGKNEDSMVPVAMHRVLANFL